jgi:hypothetical protein
LGSHVVFHEAKALPHRKGGPNILFGVEKDKWVDFVCDIPGNRASIYMCDRCMHFLIHRITLTDAGIRAMNAADGDEDEDVPVDVFTTLAQAASKLLVSGELPALPATFNSGVKV